MKFSFRLAQAFVRVRKNQYLFFASEAVWGDNLKEFYDFIKTKENIEAVVLVQNKQLYYKLKKELKVNVKYYLSISGLIMFLRSECVIIYNGSSKLHFFPYCLSPDLKPVFNLWHGIPLKKIGRKVDIHRNRMAAYLFQEYSKFFVCSPTEGELIKDCFDLSDSEIAVTGVPRNDVLFREVKDDYFEIPLEDKKVILYAPTWREYGNTSAFFPWENVQLNDVDAFLEENDAVILLRGHRQEIGKGSEILEQLENTKNIFLAPSDRYPDIMQIMKFTDVLITDYSSIYLDFILLNRPIIFIPYDIEEYQKYRGFLMDYHLNTPGIKVNTLDEFMSSLSLSLTNPSRFDKERKLILDTFHTYQDGHSSERVLSCIEEVL